MGIAAFLFGTMIIFLVIMWFWLLITVIGDLFRRDDIGGISKILWIILLVFAPYLGVFIYLLTNSSDMAKRNSADAASARNQMRSFIGTSAADEIVKLDTLKAAGTITADEHARLRAQAIG